MNDKKLQKLLENQRDKQEAQINEEHRRIQAQEKHMSELSSMLSVETNNAQTMTKQLGEGITLLKESKQKLTDIKSYDKKQKAMIKQLEDKIVLVQNEKKQEIQQLKKKQEMELNGIVERTQKKDQLRFEQEA